MNKFADTPGRGKLHVIRIMKFYQEYFMPYRSFSNNHLNP